MPLHDDRRAHTRAMVFGRCAFGGTAVVAAAAVLAALVLAGCAQPVAPGTAPMTTTVAPNPVAASVVARNVPPPSAAATPRAYRKDAANHLYAINAERIYKGKLPPMLYAVGVLEVDVDRRGQIASLHWLRAPSHAPEVVAEIERTARDAAPYPVPQRLGKVTYTDTWLWDKSGRFQLDTLSEGQN